MSHTPGPFRPRRISGPPPPDDRRSVLAAWRRVDLTPLEIEAANVARSVADLVPATLQRYAIERKRTHAEVVRVWSQLLDPTLTSHAKPGGLRNGTLFVIVDSSAWLDEIVRYRRREILDRLQHAFGRETIRAISFRVG
ncbi:MAG: DUF721 domain-containing protein [Verrucomicrobiales bacterium]|nr:DUF721 domain-containing protein [Verrucomicrobiales bacterium]MCP5519808.1 DUF721 domain-containing protein [Verrucomicrobiales bacterium]